MSPDSLSAPDWPTVTQHWVVRKPAASGRGGVVVSQSHLVSEIGADVLAEGGTAADAAVAMAFALSSAEPWNSGIGGVGYGVVRTPSGDVRALDFGPVSPLAATPALYPLTGADSGAIFGWPGVVDDRNVHGPLSACVPSAVAGYGLLHDRFGRLPWQALVAPAADLARRGMTKDWFSTVKLAQCAGVLRRYPSTRALYLPDGLPPVFPEQGAPDYLHQGGLAETLDRIARDGARDFYAGGLAADILVDLEEVGAVLARDDLARCRALEATAPSAPWRDLGRIYHAGGLTGAPTLERVMALMAGVEPGSELGAGSEAGPDATWYAAAARAMKRAFAERLAGLGGSSDPQLAAATCTSQVCAMDAEGMTVTLTTTLLSLMGSGLVLPRTGILLNNGIMWFDPRPDARNAIAGGRRPLANMLPVLFVSDDGATVIAGGASGGRRILSAVYQMLAFLLDFAMPLETAAHHPRIDVSGPLAVGVDRRLGRDVLAAIAGDGPARFLEHVAAPINFGCPSFALSRDGTFSGISDCMTPWSAAVAPL